MLHYLLLDTTHANYADALALMADIHRQAHPRNDLSVIENQTGTRAVVKVDGVGLSTSERYGPGGPDDAMESGLIVQAWSPSEHDDVKTLLAGSDWRSSADTLPE